ncbi:MAG: hypothetical protein KGJ21_09975, partial [Pseudomonadota bacterium]|nr:hypothetical protein [Pseudomonadota bacterium]
RLGAGADVLVEHFVVLEGGCVVGDGVVGDGVDRTFRYALGHALRRAACRAFRRAA